MLIPTGKEISAKDICRDKGGNDGGNNQNGFCPECGNFGCCPGQYCLPECSVPCPSNGQQQQQQNQQQFMGQQGGGGQQQFMMGGGGGNYNGGGNGYGNGGGQRKRRTARRATILTLRRKIEEKIEPGDGLKGGIKDREMTVLKYTSF